MAIESRDYSRTPLPQADLRESSIPEVLSNRRTLVSGGFKALGQGLEALWPDRSAEFNRRANKLQSTMLNHMTQAFRNLPEGDPRDEKTRLRLADEAVNKFMGSGQKRQRKLLAKDLVSLGEPGFNKVIDTDAVNRSDVMSLRESQLEVPEKVMIRELGIRPEDFGGALRSETGPGGVLLPREERRGKDDVRVPRGRPGERPGPRPKRLRIGDEKLKAPPPGRRPGSVSVPETGLPPGTKIYSLGELIKEGPLKEFPEIRNGEIKVVQGKHGRTYVAWGVNPQGPADGLVEVPNIPPAAVKTLKDFMAWSRKNGAQAVRNNDPMPSELRGQVTDLLKTLTKEEFDRFTAVTNLLGNHGDEAFRILNDVVGGEGLSRMFRKGLPILSDGPQAPINRIIAKLPDYIKNDFKRRHPKLWRQELAKLILGKAIDRASVEGDIDGTRQIRVHISREVASGGITSSVGEELLGSIAQKRIEKTKEIQANNKYLEELQGGMIDHNIGRALRFMGKGDADAAMAQLKAAWQQLGRDVSPAVAQELYTLGERFMRSAPKPRSQKILSNFISSVIRPGGLGTKTAKLQALAAMEGLSDPEIRQLLGALRDMEALVPKITPEERKALDVPNVRGISDRLDAYRSRMGDAGHRLAQRKLEDVMRLMPQYKDHRGVDLTADSERYTAMAADLGLLSLISGVPVEELLTAKLAPQHTEFKLDADFFYDAFLALEHTRDRVGENLREELNEEQADALADMVLRMARDMVTDKEWNEMLDRRNVERGGTDKDNVQEKRFFPNVPEKVKEFFNRGK